MFAPHVIDNGIMYVTVRAKSGQTNLQMWWEMLQKIDTVEVEIMTRRSGKTVYMPQPPHDLFRARSSLMMKFTRGASTIRVYGNQKIPT